MRVLVVDWDPVARAAMVGAVRQQRPFGYSAEVVEMASAKEAEARAQRDNAFDLVLVEYQLTDGYGLRVADAFARSGAVVAVVSAVGGLCPEAKARVLPKAEVADRMAGWVREAHARSTERWAASVGARSNALALVLRARRRRAEAM